MIRGEEVFMYICQGTKCQGQGSYKYEERKLHMYFTFDNTNKKLVEECFKWKDQANFAAFYVLPQFHSIPTSNIC